MLIGDKARFAVEIGEFCGGRTDYRRVDLWAANHWLTCADNSAHVGAFANSVRRSIDKLQSGSPLAPPVAGLTPTQMHRQAKRKNALTRWQLMNWTETTDNFGAYFFRLEDRLVMTFEFWWESHEPAEERGEIFVAEFPEQEFIEILKRTVEVLQAGDPRHRPGLLHEHTAKTPVPGQPDVYGEQLRRASEIIQTAGFSAEVRGGTAPFVFATHGDRAAELYSAGEDGWELEFFEEPEEFGLRKDWKTTPELAADSVVEWLSGRS